MARDFQVRRGMKVLCLWEVGVELLSLHAVCTNTVFNYLSELRQCTEHIAVGTFV